MQELVYSLYEAGAEADRLLLVSLSSALNVTEEKCTIDQSFSDDAFAQLQQNMEPEVWLCVGTRN